MWIFKSCWQDFFKLYLPGILGVVVLEFFSSKMTLPVSFYLFVFFFLDIGHVYTTWWRTIFHAPERERTHYTWSIPLVVSLLSVTWWYFKIPYYWHFVTYFTIFHNLRQGWGVVRWYEKLNNRFESNSWFYYALTILPILIFHLRTLTFKASFYSGQDLLFTSTFPSFTFQGMTFDNEYYLMVLALYILIALAWVAKELFFIFRNHRVEINRLLAMTYFFSVYAYSFIFSDKLSEVLAVLVLSHAWPYVFIIGKHLKGQKWNSKKIVLSLAAVLLFGSISSYFFEEYWLEDIFTYTTSYPSVLEYLLTLAYITPILSHFMWDFYLWKRTHPESSDLYNS